MQCPAAVRTKTPGNKDRPEKRMNAWFQRDHASVARRVLKSFLMQPTLLIHQPSHLFALPGPDHHVAAIGALQTPGRSPAGAEIEPLTTSPLEAPNQKNHRTAPRRPSQARGLASALKPKPKPRMQSKATPNETAANNEPRFDTAPPPTAEIDTQAARLAHDINNLLSPLLLSLDIVSPALSDPFHRTMVRNSRKSLMRAVAMTSEVLATARGARAMSISTDPFELIKEVHELVCQSLPAVFDFRVEAAMLPCRVAMSASDLHRVLLNLCLNALDAMPAGGTLTLRMSGNPGAAPAGGQGESGPASVLFEISDTGCGIPRSILNDIFVPFFSTKGRGKGEGLGLYTVRSIVERNGGAITVQSEPCRGTTFRFTLPMIEMPGLSAAA